MRSTPKYTRTYEMGVLGVLRCTSGPGATGKNQFFSTRGEVEKYIEVHQVHPDQIGSAGNKVHPRTIVITAAQS